jgi:hypothetical protein
MTRAITVIDKRGTRGSRKKTHKAMADLSPFLRSQTRFLIERTAYQTVTNTNDTGVFATCIYWSQCPSPLVKYSGWSL